MELHCAVHMQLFSVTIGVLSTATYKISLLELKSVFLNTLPMCVYCILVCSIYTIDIYRNGSNG